MPLHPLTVHLPIGLLFIGGVFLIISLINKEPSLLSAVFISHFSGTLSLLVATFTGRSAMASLDQSSAFEDLLQTHEIMGYVLCWYFIMLLIWLYLKQASFAKNFISTSFYLFTASYLIGLILIAYSAHLGGLMVYEYGAGVLYR